MRAGTVALGRTPGVEWRGIYRLESACSVPVAAFAAGVRMC